MRRRILIVPPAQRAAVESALGALFGEGWEAGCLTSYPQPTRPDDALPAATAYVCDAHFDDLDAAAVDALAAEDPARVSAAALAVGETPDGPRLTLTEALAMFWGG